MELLPRTVCRTSRQRLSRSTQRHAFSTSSKLPAITPESPRYIDVPQSFQPDWKPPRFVKGRLPVPRELFPASQPDKPSPQYLARVTKDPKNPIDASRLSEEGKHKLRLSAMRKEYLRQGLTQLHARKQTAHQQMAMRSDEKQAERDRLLAQADREDARLTNVSVPQSMQPDQKIDLSSLERVQIHNRKAANIAAHEAHKADLRRDQLHMLYVNSQNFIVTEEQLNAKINEEFRHDRFNPSPLARDISYWDSVGAPDTIAELVDSSTTSPRMRPNSRQYEAAWERDQKRMKRIAEKLSGGKIGDVERTHRRDEKTEPFKWVE